MPCYMNRNIQLNNPLLFKQENAICTCKSDFQTEVSTLDSLHILQILWLYFMYIKAMLVRPKFQKFKSVHILEERIHVYHEYN